MSTEELKNQTEEKQGAAPPADQASIRDASAVTDAENTEDKHELAVEPPKKKGKKRFALIIIVLLLLGLAGYRFVEFTTDHEEEAKVPVNVEITQAAVSSITVTTPLSGRIEPEDSISVVSPLQAEITKVHVKVGDYVKSGAALFSVDTQQLQYSYDQAYSQYTTAVESLELASVNLDRMQTLYTEGIIPLQQLEQAQSTYDSCVAAVNQAQVGLNSINNNLSQGTVTAPIAGYLTAVNVIEGGFPPTTQAAVEIASTDRLEIKTNISEYLVSRVKEGDSVDVYVKSLSDQPFKATIKSLSKAPSTGGLTYPVKIDASGIKDVMAGMFAEVHIVSDQRTGIICIPADSVMIKGGKSIVVVLEDNIPVFREVETGLDDGILVEIISGLYAGETVVCVGQEYVSEGHAVNVVGQSSENTGSGE